MNDNYLIRQSGLIPKDTLGVPITIIGSGAIGSFTALSLSKMGFGNITVIDFDEVSEENMSCQWFGPGDIGQLKVKSLADQIKTFTGMEIEARNEYYKEGVFNGIVISAVDSMEVRKMIYEAHKETFGVTELLIDPRMGAESALLYAVDPNCDESKGNYEKTLYSDVEAAHEPCTAKSTMYTALLLSGMVCKVVKDFVCKTKMPKTVLWSIKDNDMEVYT
jgi:hypothetical protein